MAQNNKHPQKECCKQKVILGYSGGLDTKFCLAQLKEQGYEVITVTVNTGGFDEDKLTAIEESAKELGSSKHYTIDAEEKIYEKIIQYLIKLNGLYEGDYPIMCSDRHIIAEEMLSIAGKENTKIVAHGCTGAGNDQVRFDSAILALNSKAIILAPVRQLAISRESEIAYLESKGFEVSIESKKYTINENIFGTTFSGSEIDLLKEPDKKACKLVFLDNGYDANCKYLEIEFKEGLPIKLDGEVIPGIKILKKLNAIVGNCGYGKQIYTGDCIIGIKGHILFEAPGILTLIEAHKKLEQITLTKEQIMLNQTMSSKWADLVYSAKYYEPVVKNIEAYADSVQANVNGIVKIKLEANRILIVELSSPNSLLKAEKGSYAQKATWSSQEAEGFINIYSMQQQISMKQSNEK